MPKYNLTDLIENKGTGIPSNSVPMWDGCVRTTMVIPNGSSCSDLVQCLTPSIVLGQISSTPSITKGSDGFNINQNWLYENIVSDRSYPNISIGNKSYDIGNDILDNRKLYFIDGATVHTLRKENKVYFRGLSGLNLNIVDLEDPMDINGPAIPTISVDLPSQNRTEGFVLTWNESTSRAEWRASSGSGSSNIDCTSVMNCPGISNIVSDLNSLTSRVTSMEGTLTTLSGQIPTINSSLASLGGRVTTLENGYNSLNNRLTTVEGEISNLDTRIDNIDTSITNLSNDSGKVKVGDNSATAKYLSSSDFDDSGATTVIKTQSSIDKDTFGLKLVNDIESPAPNQKYGTNDLGVKGWYPDAGSGEFHISVTLSNSVICTHNLGKNSVSIMCYDLSNNEVKPGEILKSSNNEVILSFTPVFTGDIFIS